MVFYRKGRRLIAVGSGFDTKRSRSVESAKLLTWGLTNFDIVEIAKSNTPIEKVEVWHGKSEFVNTYIKKDFYKTIPKGKVKTYKQVAIGINRPKSARAVANACAKNPYAPKVPCHRVIRSDGTLGGFSSPGGIKTKKKLLKKEGFSL